MHAKKNLTHPTEKLPLAISHTLWDINIRPMGGGGSTTPILRNFLFLGYKQTNKQTDKPSIYLVICSNINVPSLL